MPAFVAFLRSVNVGGRTYPMAELRAAVAAAGFEAVATHIQTGNVHVQTTTRSAVRVAEQLERVFAADRGFEVPTVVRTPAEVRQVVADAEELDEGAGAGVTRHHVELMREAPDPDGVALVEAQTVPGCRFVVRGREVHLLLETMSFHEVRAAPAAVRRVMGGSTNRNLTVLRAIARKWG